MLAYVFWHWPNPSSASDYESLQRAFQSALATAAPPGFAGSTIYRVDGQAAWLAGAPAYADLYLLENSAAIDALNTAAVSGVCEAPHNAVARAMAAGAGSLFALRTGAPGRATSVTFLTKPRTLPYPEFDARIAPLLAGASVWRRALVLGPTPEFAVLSATPVEFPADLQPLRLGLTAL